MLRVILLYITICLIHIRIYTFNSFKFLNDYFLILNSFLNTAISSDRYIVIEVVRSDDAFPEMCSHRGLCTSTSESVLSSSLTSSKLTGSQSSSSGTRKLPSKSAMAMRREQRIRTPTAFENALKDAILESVLAAHGDWGYGMIKSWFRSKYFFVIY